MVVPFPKGAPSLPLAGRGDHAKRGGWGSHHAEHQMHRSHNLNPPLTLPQSLAG